MGTAAGQQSNIVFRMEREQLRAASLFFQNNAEDSSKRYCHCRKTNEQLALQNGEGVSGSMKSWSEKKKEIQSIDPVRVNELEAVAQLVNAIHRRRVELGWTQKELADKVGLHQESVARIENGGSVPRLDTVFRLAIALGLELKLQNRGFRIGS